MPENRVPAVSFLNLDLACTGDWCKRSGILVNPIKTKTGDFKVKNARTQFSQLVV